MKNSKKIFATIMVTAMTLGMSSQGVKAEDGPIVSNPSFESKIDKSDIQLYKAERTNEEAYDGNYSIKVGALKPEDESKVPLWRYTQGKGSVNVIVRNIEPNTTYKVKTHYKKASGVKMSTGVLDVDGDYSVEYPWKLASKIKTDSSSKPSNDWQTHEFEITTGPRTDEMYVFAYTEWTGQENGSGLFYFDDVEVTKVKSVEKNVKTIDYVADISGFPNTVPAIQDFSQTDGKFKLTKKHQVFSTDDYSKKKTTYLAKAMKDKGIIEDYSINVIDNVKQAKGITLFKQPIQFKLGSLAKNSPCEKDAYQIDITEDKVVIYSNYIEGIQNGSMTILQAFAQRDSLNCGIVKDYTDQNVRGLQVDSGRRYYTIDWLKKQIEQMAYYKQNVLQLRLKDNEGIRYDSKVASPMKDDKGGFWTQAEVNELVNYAKKFNIKVIPEIDFPGHAEQDAAYYKDWGLGGSTKALDFSKPEVRKYMIDVYKEAVKFFDADTIHIGGDEFFQSGYTDKGKEILTNWAQEVTGNPKATDRDALILFFNEAAEELYKMGVKNVLVWNDNIFDLDSVVKLDKRVIIDFWGGGIYGSIIASEATNAGYKVMSSSSSNYHDLWPQQGQNKLDRPAPKNLYKNFNRYLYSKSAFNYPFYTSDETLTKNLDQVQGQVFPIWDDAHGYVPEYILSRTLFPRYAGFVYKMWGAEYENDISYEAFERLAYAVESPKTNLLGKQVAKKYTQKDYEEIVKTLKAALVNLETKDEKIKKNIDELNTLLNKENNKTLYTVSEIENLIRKFENVTYVSDIGKVTVKYVDESNNELVDPIIIEGDVGEAYSSVAKEIDGYKLKEKHENEKGRIEKDEQTVVYVYEKVQESETPTTPDDGNDSSNVPNDSDNVKPSNPTNNPNNNNQQNNNVVKTDDNNAIVLTSVIGLLALIGIGILIRKKHN